MKTIGVVINPKRDKALEVFSELEQLAVDRGFSVSHATTDIEERPEDPDQIHQLVQDVDVVVTLGGDGTLLRAGRAIGSRDVPVIGVNVGSLGFLTSVADTDIERMLDALASGSFVTSVRSVLECVVERDGHPVRTARGLNDIVLNSGGSTRVITLQLDVDDRGVNTFVCDGVIVATPTGSTGHNLSAGGPIVHPEAPVLLTTVLCPHALSARPMVLTDTSVLSVRVQSCEMDLLLSVDGQRREALGEGDRVIISKSPDSLRLLQLEGYDYFDVMRKKLHWRGMNY